MTDELSYEVSKKVNFFDIAKSINQGKYIKDIDDTTKYDCNTYMLGILFSNTPDSVLVANEANKFTINNPRMHYDFYYHLLPFNPKRYGKWHKSVKDTNEETIEKIMEVYCYSREKAVQCLQLILQNKEAMEYINEVVSEGGTSTTKRKGSNI